MGRKLSRVLWAHKTTREEAINETLFSLAFSTKAVVLVEMDMPSYRVDYYDPKINKDMAKLSLDLLEKKRDIARTKTMAYKERVAWYYNRRVNKREFKKGDLVLRKVDITIRHTLEGKLALNWEGPYQVR